MIYTVKPQTPIINWGHPLAKQMSFDCPLFEGGGPNTTDLVSRQRGAFNGTITWGVGSVGLALTFSSWIGWPAAFSLGNTVFTIVAMVYPTGSGSRAIRGDGGGGQNNGIEFRLNSTHNLELLQQNTASIGTSSGTVTQSAWSFVSVSYDASGNYAFYINGVQSGTGTNLKTLTPVITQIGGQASGVELWSGKIALVRQYSRVLTYTEIRQLYVNPWQIYSNPSPLNLLVSNPVVLPGGFASYASNTISQPLNFDSAMSV